MGFSGFPHLRLDDWGLLGYTLWLFVDSRLFQRSGNEEDLSAEPSQAGKDARVPQADEHGRRSQGCGGSSQAWPQAARCLSFG